MFTGIVEEVGKVHSITQSEGGWTMEVACKSILEDVNLGESIAVNGTCLTVTSYPDDRSRFTCNFTPETNRRTNLGRLKEGHSVNLERSVKPSGRMGGHFVQGHVDCTASVIEKRVEGNSLWMHFRPNDASMMQYIVEKGYIAIDGTSLTVCNVSGDSFNVMLVPHTQENVVLPHREIDDICNLEVDILGKYSKKMLDAMTPSWTDKLLIVGSAVALSTAINFLFSRR